MLYHITHYCYSPSRAINAHQQCMPRHATTAESNNDDDHTWRVVDKPKKRASQCYVVRVLYALAVLRQLLSLLSLRFVALLSLRFIALFGLLLVFLLCILLLGILFGLALALFLLPLGLF